MSAPKALWLAVIFLKLVPTPLLAEERGLRASLQEDSGYVYALAFSPDGKTLASGSDVATVQLWDAASGKKTGTFQGYGKSRVHALAFNPDGKTLASGSGDGTIRLWDLATGKITASLEGHAGALSSLSFSADGKILASGSTHGGTSDKTLHLWDVASAKSNPILGEHAHPVMCLALMPDGTTLAVGSQGNSIKLWNLTSGRNTARLQGQTEADVVWSVAISPDGKTLASGGSDRTVRLWELATGKERAILRGHGWTVWQVAFSPDGRILASASGDKTIRLWDLASTKSIATLKGHTEAISSVSFSPDGKTLASGSYDRTIKLWDVPSAKQAEATPLSPKDLDALWNTLASDDAAQAYEAMNRLVASPSKTTSLMKERLRPLPEPNIRRWIDDLDSGQFDVRKKARTELERLAEAAEPALLKRLAEKPPLEVHRQIEALLSRIERQQLYLYVAPDLLKGLRAVEVLEHIGNSDAKRVLETLAKTPESSRLTREARAALGRLTDRRATLPEE